MTRFLSFAGILTYYGLNIFRFGLWLRLLEFGLARSAPPLRGGRRIDLPQGAHRRPPAFFHYAIWGKAFWDTSTSAILCVFDSFWAPLGAILESLEPS